MRALGPSIVLFIRVMFMKNNQVPNILTNFSSMGMRQLKLSVILGEEVRSEIMMLSWSQEMSALKGILGTLSLVHAFILQMRKASPGEK